jgi:hypothetical protein
MPHVKIPTCVLKSPTHTRVVQLAVRCLSYDFVGHASFVHSAQIADDSDTLTLAIPLSWKGDLSNPALTDMLFSIFYKVT